MPARPGHQSPAESTILAHFLPWQVWRFKAGTVTKWRSLDPWEPGACHTGILWTAEMLQFLQQFIYPNLALLFSVGKINKNAPSKIQTFNSGPLSTGALRWHA